MAKKEAQLAVRPLPFDRRSRVSRATLAMLLLTGGVVGYFLGLPTTKSTAPPPAEPPPTTAAAFAPVGGSAPTTADYDWLEQRRTGSLQRAYGVFAAVDLDNVLYLLVFADTDSPEKRVLWRSDDGMQWTEIPLALGDAVVHDLDVYQNTLLLSGWLDGAPAVWRSQTAPDREFEWTATRLGEPFADLGEVRYLESTVQAEVNAEGEITVAVRAQADIAPVLLGFAGDPNADSVLQLPGQPEIAARGQRLWASLIAADNTESVHSVELPPTTILEPASGSYLRLGLITAGSLWVSADGSTYEPVDLADLPRAPVPQAMGDKFVSVVESPRGDHQLWISGDGYDWSPNSSQPPVECGGWDSLVVGGPGMLLISDNFDTACVSEDIANWVVRDPSGTSLATTGQVWTSGSATGFLALARNSQEFAVLISADGLDWQPIEFAKGLLGTHTFLVGDRLITNAMTNGPPPLGRRFSVWVGNPRQG